MKHLRVICPLVVGLVICCVASTAANADFVCDAIRTAASIYAEEHSSALNIYVKSNKVKMEWVDDSAYLVLRSDLQAILNIVPSEGVYQETGFSQLYVLPFGPLPLTISPGFGEPIVEFIDTGGTELINGLSCKKYVISEITASRLLQYTIFATDELNFAETFSSFFSSTNPIEYKPFEEMRKIPGLPLKISISETVGDSTFVQTYEFSNFQESSLDDSVFNVPGGYTLK
jgi:hypothetical protein